MSPLILCTARRVSRARAAASRLAAFGTLAVSATLLLTACAPMPAQRTSGTGTVERLYVLYCGEAQIPDVSPWSPGFNVGTRATFSDNCYLMRHAKGWMLWDSGYPDSLAERPEGLVGPRSTALRKKTLAAQLAELGLAPAQITHLAFSHSHADHVGNGNLFTAATLFIQQTEYEAAFGPDAAKFGFQSATYDKLRVNPTVKLNGDHDIFGDDSVTILSTPGHTPGHQSRCSSSSPRPARWCSRATWRIFSRTSTCAACRDSTSTARAASPRWNAWPPWCANTGRNSGSTTTSRRTRHCGTRGSSTTEPQEGGRET